MSSLRESVCSRTSPTDVREHTDSLKELMMQCPDEGCSLGDWDEVAGNASRGTLAGTP